MLISVGDIVELKTGSSKRTVIAIESDTAVLARGGDNGKIFKTRYPLKSLKLSHPEIEDGNYV